MLEILAPAGNMACANAAINNGANAIYLGLGNFSARQGAENFDALAFEEVVKKAHFFGVKVYVVSASAALAVGINAITERHMLSVKIVVINLFIIIFSFFLLHIIYINKL